MTSDRAAVVRYRMGRAERSLRAARGLADAGFWNDVVNRLYYACFYAASALLLDRGVTTRRHTGVVNQFNQHFLTTAIIDARTGQTLQTLFHQRQLSDYEDLCWFDEATVRPWLAAVEDFVASVRALLGAAADESSGDEAARS